MATERFVYEYITIPSERDTEANPREAMLPLDPSRALSEAAFLIAELNYCDWDGPYLKWPIIKVRRHGETKWSTYEVKVDWSPSYTVRESNDGN